MNAFENLARRLGVMIELGHGLGNVRYHMDGKNHPPTPEQRELSAGEEPVAPNSWPGILRDAKDAVELFAASLVLTERAIDQAPDPDPGKDMADRWRCRLRVAVADVARHAPGEGQWNYLPLPGNWSELLGDVERFAVEAESFSRSFAPPDDEWAGVKFAPPKASPKAENPNRGKRSIAEWESLVEEFEARQEQDQDLTPAKFGKEKNIGRTTIQKAFARVAAEREKRMSIARQPRR